MSPKTNHSRFTVMLSRTSGSIPILQGLQPLLHQGSRAGDAPTFEHCLRLMEQLRCLLPIPRLCTCYAHIGRGGLEA